MGKKSSKRTEFVLFNVTYEDGSQRSIAACPSKPSKGRTRTCPPVASSRSRIARSRRSPESPRSPSRRSCGPDPQGIAGRAASAGVGGRNPVDWPRSRPDVLPRSKGHGARACGPALEVGELLQRDQQRLALRFRQGVEFGVIVHRDACPHGIANSFDPCSSQFRVVPMLQQHPPQREPPLADVGTSLDVVAQALAPGTGPGAGAWRVPVLSRRHSLWPRS